MEVPTFITATEDTLNDGNSSLSLFNDSLDSGSPKKPSEMLNDSLCLEEDDACLSLCLNEDNSHLFSATTELPSKDISLHLVSDVATLQNASQNSSSETIGTSESSIKTVSNQSSACSSPTAGQNKIAPIFGKKKATTMRPKRLSDVTNKHSNCTEEKSILDNETNSCDELASTMNGKDGSKENVSTNLGLKSKPPLFSIKKSKNKMAVERSLKIDEAEKIENKTKVLVEKCVKLSKKEKMEQKEMKEKEKKEKMAEKERLKAEKKLALEKKKAEKEQKKIEKDLEKMERQRKKDKKKGKSEESTTVMKKKVSEEIEDNKEVFTNGTGKDDGNEENISDENENRPDTESQCKENVTNMELSHRSLAINTSEESESIDEMTFGSEEKDQSVSEELMNKESLSYEDSQNRFDSNNVEKILWSDGYVSSQENTLKESLTNDESQESFDSINNTPVQSVDNIPVSKLREEVELEKEVLADNISSSRSRVLICKTVKKHSSHKPVFNNPKGKASKKKAAEKRKQDSSSVSKQAKRYKSKSLPLPCQPSSVWVQCDHPECLKWRLLRDVTDPTRLPDKWYCSMNKDSRYNSCSANEESWSDPGDNMEFIYSPYNLGSLVVAKLEGYPWWPAMIDNDPDQNCYYEQSTISASPVRYHVVFFDKPVTRGWIHALNIRPLTEDSELSDFDEVSGKYQQSLFIALEQARKALLLTTVDRLQKYGFKVLYRRDRKRKMSKFDDDETPKK